MSPAAALLACAALLLALPGLGPGALLGILLLLLLCNGRQPAVWWRFLRRTRWLLLTTWLLVAYNTPGELWRGLPWAPSEEGLYDATWQGVRLVIMLGCLATLFLTYSRQEVLAGLYGLLQSGRRPLWDARRLVVRLALVLEYLERQPEAGAWRRMLLQDAPPPAGDELLRIEPSRWRVADAGLLSIVLLSLWMLH